MSSQHFKNLFEKANISRMEILLTFFKIKPGCLVSGTKKNLEFIEMMELYHIKHYPNPEDKKYVYLVSTKKIPDGLEDDDKMAKFLGFECFNFKENRNNKTRFGVHVMIHRGNRQSLGIWPFVCVKGDITSEKIDHMLGIVSKIQKLFSKYQVDFRAALEFSP